MTEVNPSDNSASENAKSKSSASDIFWVSKSDLPLACPLDKHKVWNQHPRVFLTVDSEKPVQCPYCGNRYQLKVN
ncbi:MAG: zinc-finger domain-containing protein [Gammaproteobacteria bacterium]|nr:zinc-finger domain-containing protein [Gammaproteobacteria bacterium]